MFSMSAGFTIVSARGVAISLAWLAGKYGGHASSICARECHTEWYMLSAWWAVGGVERRACTIRAGGRGRMVSRFRVHVLYAARFVLIELVPFQFQRTLMGRTEGPHDS